MAVIDNVVLLFSTFLSTTWGKTERETERDTHTHIYQISKGQDCNGLPTIWMITLGFKIMLKD